MTDFKKKHYRHAVIMTFPAKKLKEYSYCLRGFIENWPPEVFGIALVEGAQEIQTLAQKNLKILEFNDCVGEKVKRFEERNLDKDISNLSSVGNITNQAAKFSRKAYAQIYALENLDCDYLHYLDADLFTHKKISLPFLDTLIDEEYLLACLPRWWQRNEPPENALTNNSLHIGFTETGYIIWNKKHFLFNEWLAKYKECYDFDKIFEFKAWHDCIAFDYATLSCLGNSRAQIKDLSNGVLHSHPLVVGPLGKYFDHMKGARKFQGFSKEQILKHGNLLEKLKYHIKRAYNKI